MKADASFIVEYVDRKAAEKAEEAGAKGEIQAKQVEQIINKDIAAFRTEMDQKFELLRTEMNQRFESLTAELHANNAEMHRTFATKADVASAKAEMIKWMFIFWATQITATIGIILLFVRK
jgi:hypothetical protein